MFYIPLHSVYTASMGSAAEKKIQDYDVLIIGAGISGINFAYRIQERCPTLSYAILDARHEVGGTWSLFKYPGKACQQL